MRSGDFGVPETKAPLVRCGVGRWHSADIGTHTEALALLRAQRGFRPSLHLGSCCRWKLPVQRPGCWESMLRALEDPASHIPDVLGGGFLNADYWFHWSSQSTSFFPRRLLKCHWVNIADKKKWWTKKSYFNLNKLAICRLDHMKPGQSSWFRQQLQEWTPQRDWV